MSWDVRRLRHMVSGPGTDTRVWVSLGVIQSVEHNPDGIIAEVALIPNENTAVCAVASSYAGPGYGLVSAPQEGDTVVVLIPNGDTDWRPVVMGVLWSAVDAPPSEAGLPDFNVTQDVILRVQNEKNLRIITTQGGNVNITIEGAGNVNIKVADGVVRLGDDTSIPTDGVVHGSGFDPFTGQTYYALGSASSKVFARKS